MSLYDRIVLAESYPNGPWGTSRIADRQAPAGPDALPGNMDARLGVREIGNKWMARRRPERAPAKKIRSFGAELAGSPHPPRTN